MTAIQIHDEITDEAPVGKAIGKIHASRIPTEVPSYRYISPEFAALEMQRMWPKVWQLACSVTHVANPGDCFVYNIGKLSVLIVRGDDGVIRAFQNCLLYTSPSPRD